MNAKDAELMRLAVAAVDAALHVSDVEEAAGPQVKGMLMLARMRMRSAMP